MCKNLKITLYPLFNPISHLRVAYRVNSETQLSSALINVLVSLHFNSCADIGPIQNDAKHLKS